ncbi:Cmx/CmrA family chloramphenicol efflux MFS transporter [Amycolatopsis suaedae]|uniref:MFS transporter n=1 Tax=Amycolatopsis suaedae TaxID=2510978 RepID=A0A4Q7J1T2_9PSEU|nr:Cmx/CmrA family chloramphenicol efflux MFS transporter [Amycolatopsis suaedae]RZQ60817.1 MFS transporter [Amycolatopsis suaedae]
MPLAVYLLGLAIFVQGTSEFMLSGLLPDIAADLGVTIPEAGLLTSAFALGMVIGGPPLAVATLRWSRRRALVWFLAVFAAVHVVGALTTSYELLLVTRVVSAVANAGFWAVAAATAIGMVAPDAKARAMSVVVGGITVACVAGVPGGAVLGQLWGWRSAFWAVAVLSVLTLAFLVRVPAGRGQAATGLRGELRVLANRRLWVAFATIALAEAAMFGVFTYLAPLATGTAGLPASWVPGLLVLFGAGSVLGITVGGRIADARPYQTLFAGLTALTLACAALAVLADSGPALIALVFLIGLLGFGINPAMSSRAFYLGAAAPTLVGASVTSAFNVGNMLGPWLGGVTIGAGLGFGSVAWIGAALAAAAIATVALALTLRGRQPVPAQARA